VPEIEAFRFGWQAADAEGRVGNRIRQGLRALYAYQDSLPAMWKDPDHELLAKKAANAKRAEGGIPGIYRSALAMADIVMILPRERPQPVVLVDEEPFGWWFYLPETWPNPDWVGDVRWFEKRDGASFVLLEHAEPA
jgi:hypothetical protein